jgi:hypothetical protein
MNFTQFCRWTAKEADKARVETSCIKWRSPDDKRPGCDCESSRGCKRDVADPFVSHAQDRVKDAEHENLKPAQPETLARTEPTGLGVDFLQTVKEAAVAMAQDIPHRRETHALFAALQVESGAAQLSRAEKDRLTALERDALALPFAVYMADGAEYLLNALDDYMAAWLALEESDEPADAIREAHDSANMHVGECMKRLRSCVYEYRKRSSAQSGG